MMMETMPILFARVNRVVAVALVGQDFVVIHPKILAPVDDLDCVVWGGWIIRENLEDDPS